jgi:hypothetical protein
MQIDPTVNPEWYVIQEYNSADHIVRGVVINTIDRSGYEDADPEIEYQYSEIKILQTYKGVKLSKVKTRSPITCCLCGQNLDIGKEYILYLDRTDGKSYALSSTAKYTSESSLDLAIITKINEGKINPKSVKQYQYLKINEQPEI